MSLRKKLLALVIIPVIVCTTLAIVTSSLNIRSQGIHGLEDKSNALLTLNILEYVENHQYGTSLFDVEVEEQLKGVTTIADTSAEEYEFRIASMQPKAKKHKANESEIPFLKKFEEERIDGLTHIDEASNSLWVMRPVYMDKEKGCMRCHKLDKETGQKLNDNDLRGIFIIKSSMSHFKAKVKESILENSIIGIIIVIIVVIIGILVLKTIMNAVKQIVGVSRNVSEGNLQSRVKINTNDELHDLGDFINNMVESLNNILQKVYEASNNLIAGTSEITNISKIISDGAHNQVVQFDEFSSSVTNTTQNVISANDLANESSRKAGMVEEEMNKITTTISAIEKSSQQIDQEVKVIEDIARNINILALNAAVEAARAGEHGKGFAIVAAEVRKLSQLTSQSSIKITEVASKSLNQVESGVEVIEQAGKKIKQIIELVNQIAHTLNEISDSTKEQTRIMENNTSITNSNSSSADRLNGSAAALSERANKLLDMVKLFKLSK